MKNKTSNTSLFTQYLCSYIVVAFIPVLTACISLFISYQALEKETIHSNQAAIRQIQNSLDIRFQNLDKILLSLNQDASLTRFALNNKPLNAISSLEKTISQQEFLEDIFIIENDEGNIYSSKGMFSMTVATDQDFATDLLKKGYTFKEWQSLCNISDITYWPVNALDQAPAYLYVFSPMYNNFEADLKMDSRTIVLLIKRDFIQDLFRSSQTAIDENILLLSSDFSLLGKLTSDVSSEMVLEIVTYLKSHPETFESGYVEYEGNMVFASRSKETGLYYVRFLSRQTAYETIYLIRNYTFLILAVVVVIGIGLVIFNTKNSFAPIRSLNNWAQSHITSNTLNGNETSKNELAIIKLILDHSFKENISLTQTLNNSKQGLIDHLLTALICGNFTTKESFSNACTNLNVPFDMQYFCVCSLLFENNLFEGTEYTSEHIIKLINETLSKQMHVHIKNLLFANKLLLVLNTNSNDIDLLRSAMTDLKTELSNLHGLRVSVGVGTFCDSYDQVGKSYLNSVNALDYRLIYGKDCVIMPNMYNTYLQNNYYPNTELMLLQSALLSQNAELATSAINCLNEHIKSNNLDLHSAKHICYDAFSILKNAPSFTNLGYVNTLSNSLNIMHLSNFDTIDDFFVALLNVVYHIIGTPTDSNHTSLDIGSQLVEYIDTHCLSYDFQISIMAEHFSISPQYMRKLFKNHTGIAISDYISSLKLEKAMQLLSETDMSLQDIVFAIGNVDVSGFVRSFKQKTGMTPGQYRKSCDSGSKK